MKKSIGKQKKKGRVDRGENFDKFLEREGLLAETEDAAIKETIAGQIKFVREGCDGFRKTSTHPTG